MPCLIHSLLWQPYNKGWFAARNIHDNEALANLAKFFNTVYFNQQGKAFQNKCAVRRQNYWLWEPKNLVCDNLALWELKPSWLSAEVGMAAP